MKQIPKLKCCINLRTLILKSREFQIGLNISIGSSLYHEGASKRKNSKDIDGIREATARMISPFIWKETITKKIKFKRHLHLIV